MVTNGLWVVALLKELEDERIGESDQFIPGEESEL